MPTHYLKRVQRMPIPLRTAWDFFADPRNLPVITPPGLRFKIVTTLSPEVKMYNGQIIDYVVKPIWRIPVHWKTRITDVREGEYFVDEQLKGPYRLWRHQHHFREIANGVEMTDTVDYRNPFGIFGGLINSLVVRKKLQIIFDYRHKKIEELFGKWSRE